MMAAPQPIKPARMVDTYEIEVDDGRRTRTLTFDAAKVDRENGRARYGGLEFTIQWRPEATKG
jgi:hypothetical protein